MPWYTYVQGTKEKFDLSWKRLEIIVVLVSVAEATGLLQALKPTAGTKAKPDTTSKPTSPAKSKPSSSAAAEKAQTPRGRATTRTDPKNDRSKSQPNQRNTPAANTGKRSTTPGRPTGKK